MNQLLYLIAIPFACGLICLLLTQRLKRVVEVFAVLASLVTFGLTVYIFFETPQVTSTYILIDNLSKFIIPAVGLFGFLITLYSCKFMAGKGRLNAYYAYVLWTIGASLGAVLANDLIVLLSFWGFLGFTLYMLIGMGGAEASAAAKKTFIIIGASDALMILGVGIIWQVTGLFEMSRITLPLTSAVHITAFVSLAIAAFAKAGAMPVHTWIPDTAATAPIPVTAFLPASLDKLLGIYLLARIAMDMFVMSKAMGVFLLIVGSFTIIAAVMMAMIQHDFKKLLSYHAVSQVGYMVLGIGTGVPVGIAGGIFHMLNHAIYKACLFLCGGGVEHRTGTSDLDKLGGLAKFMPLTFITCLIAALSISGVPPFNGFVSKWMVYQGVIEMGKGGDKLWIIWLVAAMFGSALTLASFMKLIHAIFMGQREKAKPVKEVSWTMWLPMVILAGLCVVFGVFAYSTALKEFILPAVPGVSYLGFWQPGLATILIIVGIIIGAVIYLIGRVRVREDAYYIGGEVLPQEDRVTGTDFYQTIQEMGLFRGMYKRAEAKFFDIYDQGANLVFFFTGKLQKMHTGVLPLYLIWCLVGMIALFIVFFIWSA